MRIHKLLIANRGEIACRIARTAKRLNIATVAVYTEIDRDALHARACDEAVRIGSYLDGGLLIAAAKRVNAGAVHPGYGFLAENPEFAEACIAAGLTFVGPRPATIRRMGSKAAGREVAASCGVSIVPGYQGPELAHGAEVIGYPLLLKASAGGGGRGMRIVDRPEDFAGAVESASREAGTAFGDDTLILERYIPYAHHVEVQIFGDNHGRVIHLFERDCSMQRRHQKIIEESPSPAINDVTRNHLYEAAVAIGEAMGYVNAGTVEFLVAPSGEFFFIEVNTRIQVEHPVTEMVTGLDLIEMQLAIAEGRALDEFPLVVEPMGHAIEVRLCAEDPSNGFAPSTGRLSAWHVEADRVDSGAGVGSAVSRFYDSLLAKLIVQRESRPAAIEEMVRRLKASRVLGVRTNREYLIQLLESPEFSEGRAHTSFLPIPAAPPRENIEISAQVLATWILNVEIQSRRILPRAGAFRNNPWRTQPVKLRWRDQVIEALPTARLLPVGPCGPDLPVDDGLAEVDGVTRAYRIESSGREYLVSSGLGSFVLERVERHPRPASAGSNASANSPMPGQVLRILVQIGHPVNSGDPLVVLEAMKMEQTIKSQMDGVVSAILVKAGDVVAPGQTLVQIGKGAQ